MSFQPQPPSQMHFQPLMMIPFTSLRILFSKKPNFVANLSGVPVAPMIASGGPFAANPSANSNSNFQPKSQQPDPVAAAAALKPPKAPEKPLVPYMRFSKKMWQTVRADNPDKQLWDIGKIIGEMWRNAKGDEKQRYQSEYDQEKVAYDKAMKEYHNSAPYQAYLANKTRAKQLEKEQRDRERNADRHQQQQMPPPMVAVLQQQPMPTMFTQQQPQAARYAMPPQQPQAPAAAGRHRGSHHRGSAESGVVIQPVDEDDGEAQQSVRRVSQTRFERNHRLVAELFGTQLVPDTRSIVTQVRIDMLRRQARSLDEHQKKLESEIVALESKFETKKRTIEESGENFLLLMKQVCADRPVVDEEKFQTMVTEQSQKLKEAYENYRKRDQNLSTMRNGPPPRPAVQLPMLPPAAVQQQQQTNTNGFHTDSCHTSDSGQQVSQPPSTVASNGKVEQQEEPMEQLQPTTLRSASSESAPVTAAVVSEDTANREEDSESATMTPVEDNSQSASSTSEVDEKTSTDQVNGVIGQQEQVLDVPKDIEQTEAKVDEDNNKEDEKCEKPDEEMPSEQAATTD